MIIDLKAGDGVERQSDRRQYYKQDGDDCYHLQPAQSGLNILQADSLVYDVIL